MFTKQYDELIMTEKKENYWNAVQTRMHSEKV